MRSEYSAISPMAFSERLKVGSTALESPEWIPAGSMCSINAHDVQFITVENRIYLCLRGALKELVDQYAVIRHVLENGKHVAFQLVVVDHDLHALPPQHIRRAYK